MHVHSWPWLLGSLTWTIVAISGLVYLRDQIREVSFNGANNTFYYMDEPSGTAVGYNIRP